MKRSTENGTTQAGRAARGRRAEDRGRMAVALCQVAVWLPMTAALTACSMLCNGGAGVADETRNARPTNRNSAQRQQAMRDREGLGDRVYFEGGGGDVMRRDQGITDAAYGGGGADTHTLRLYGTTRQRGAGREGLLDGLDNAGQVTFGTVGEDFDPDVDPTGTRVIYASTRHRKTSDLYIQEIGKTSRTQVTSDPARDEMPAFSPDGRRVAFASNRDGEWDIFISDLDGSPPMKVTDGPEDEIHPSFSPDGSQLVYSVFSPHAGQWEIAIIDPAQPGQRRFITYGLFPQWSPVGDKILFQRARDQNPRWFSIWTVDLVEGEARRPTEIVRCSNAAAITPTWSPDGRHVVFSTVVEPGAASDDVNPMQADVWMVRVDGSSRVNLTRNPFTNLQPVWSSTGDVLFVSNRAADRESIWTLRPQAPLQLADDVRAASESLVPGGTAAAAATAPAGAATAVAATQDVSEP